VDALIKRRKGAGHLIKRWASLQVKIFCCLPDVGVFREEVLPVSLLLPSDSIMIFFRGIIRLLFQVR
jgi:hypothetical protein